MTGASRLRAAATALMLAWALCAPFAATAQQISVETSGHGDFITVTAFADMRVDPHTVWNVISDYDHLAEFIPDMRTSRVIQRDGDKLVVEQTGRFAFLFFHQQIEVKLSVVESPQRRIAARAVGGNLREMEGLYALETLPTGEVRLSYSGRLIPEFPMPPIVGKMVVRSVMARQFTAMVKEILRRDASARDAARRP